MGSLCNPADFPASLDGLFRIDWDFHRYDQPDEVHFRRLFAAIRAYLDDLDQGQFVFRPGFGCVMCDFRDDHCLQWRG